MADRVRDIQSRLKGNLQGSDQLLAASAYIPVFGWIYPYIFKKDDELCQFHGLQSLKLNGVILFIYFAVWIAEHFPILSWFFADGRIFHPLSQALWVISLSVFLIVSLVAAYRAFSEEAWEIPYLADGIRDVFEKIRDLKA